MRVFQYDQHKNQVSLTAGSDLLALSADGFRKELTYVQKLAKQAGNDQEWAVRSAGFTLENELRKSLLPSMNALAFSTCRARQLGNRDVMGKVAEMVHKHRVKTEKLFAEYEWHAIAVATMGKEAYHLRPFTMKMEGDSDYSEEAANRHVDEEWEIEPIRLDGLDALARLSEEEDMLKGMAELDYYEGLALPPSYYSQGKSVGGSVTQARPDASRKPVYHEISGDDWEDMILSQSYDQWAEQGRFGAFAYANTLRERVMAEVPEVIDLLTPRPGMTLPPKATGFLLKVRSKALEWALRMDAIGTQVERLEGEGVTDVKLNTSRTHAVGPEGHEAFVRGGHTRLAWDPAGQARGARRFAVNQAAKARGEAAQTFASPGQGTGQLDRPDGLAAWQQREQFDPAGGITNAPQGAVRDSDIADLYREYSELERVLDRYGQLEPEIDVCISLMQLEEESKYTAYFGFNPIEMARSKARSNAIRLGITTEVGYASIEKSLGSPNVSSFEVQGVFVRDGNVIEKKAVTLYRVTYTEGSLEELKEWASNLRKLRKLDYVMQEQRNARIKAEKLAKAFRTRNKKGAGAAAIASDLDEYLF